MLGTAQAQVQVLLSEDFDNVDALPDAGWILTNQSAPPGALETWFQGDPATFPSQQGAPSAYIASNFNAAAAGGALNNWLITPEFTSTQPVVVSFYLRADPFEDASDTVELRFSDGSTDLSDFELVAPSPITVPTDGWTLYSINLGSLGATGTGRFAFVHSGESDASNYVGLDTLVISAVPEPSMAFMLGLGLAGCAIAVRRRT
jgi:hypothetical protein